MNRKIGVLFSYLLMLVEILSNLLFTPLLIRSLGKAEYGIYSWVMSITAYLYLLDLGVGNSIVKYAAQYRIQKAEKKQRNFLGVITIFYFVIGIIIIGLGILLESNFGMILNKGFDQYEIQMAKKLFWIAVLNAAATLFFGAYQKILLAYERFSLTKSLDMLKVLLRMILGIAALNYGGKSYMIVSIHFGVTVVVGMVSIVFVVKRLKIYPSINKIDKGFLKEIVGFSSVMFLQVLATQLNSMVDQVLIGILVPSATVILAVYGTGALIPQYVQSISANINGVLMPGIVRMVEEKKNIWYIEKEMIRISRIVFSILAFIGVVFGVFGKLFFLLWAGPGYEDSFWVAIIILVPQILILSQGIGTQILWAMNQHRLQSYLKLAVAVANIGLSIIMIRWNPLLGATLATAVTLVAGDICVMNIVYRKCIKISIGRYYAGILKGVWCSLAAAGIAGIAVKMILPQNILGFISGCAIMTLVYIMAELKFGMSEYEKSLVNSLLKKI